MVNTMKLQKMKKISRRSALYLLGGITGTILTPSLPLSKPNQLLERIDTLTQGVAKVEDKILLNLPEVAENGNIVKVGFEIKNPMVANNYIKHVYIFAEKNPAPDVAKFFFTPEMGICSATTKIRLSKTQSVYLLAENSNGQFLMTKRKVKVTIGGCGV